MPPATHLTAIVSCFLDPLHKTCAGFKKEVSRKRPTCVHENAHGRPWTPPRRRPWACPWATTVINGRPRMPMDVHECPGTPMDNPWASTDLRAPMSAHGRSWTPVDVHRCPRRPEDAHGCPRRPMEVHRCPRVPTDAHGCPWVPTDVHKRPREPTGAHRVFQVPMSAHGRPLTFYLCQFVFIVVRVVHDCQCAASKRVYCSPFAVYNSSSVSTDYPMM